MAQVDRRCGTALPGGPRYRLPSLKKLSDDAARRLVQSSLLAGLEPCGPGISSRTWQELAAVATQLPDIRWLGRQIVAWGDDPSGKDDYWNDFENIHKGQTTDLSIDGHRLRLGEKALKYGGIDVVLRVLSVFGPTERVGYEGIKDIFCTPSHGTREFLYYWPRTNFFMQTENWKKYIQPRLAKGRSYHTADETLTPQAIANTMFILHSRPKSRSELKVFRLIVDELGGCPVNTYASPRLADCVYSTCDTWTEMYSNDDFASVARTLWYLCADKGAPAFPSWCRGDAFHAKFLLEAPDELWDDEIEDDPFKEEDYSFLELVRRCVARRVFDNDGLELLCESVGEPLGVANTGNDVSLKRSHRALGVANQELSRCASRRRLDAPAAGA